MVAVICVSNALEIHRCYTHHMPYYLVDLLHYLTLCDVLLLVMLRVLSVALVSVVPV